MNSSCHNGLDMETQTRVIAGSQRDPGQETPFNFTWQGPCSAHSQRTHLTLQESRSSSMAQSGPKNLRGQPLQTCTASRQHQTISFGWNYPSIHEDCFPSTGSILLVGSMGTLPVLADNVSRCVSGHAVGVDQLSVRPWVTRPFSGESICLVGFLINGHPIERTF